MPAVRSWRQVVAAHTAVMAAHQALSLWWPCKQPLSHANACSRVTKAAAATHFQERRAHSLNQYMSSLDMYWSCANSVYEGVSSAAVVSADIMTCATGELEALCCCLGARHARRTCARTRGPPSSLAMRVIKVASAPPADCGQIQCWSGAADSKNSTRVAAHRSAAGDACGIPAQLLCTCRPGRSEGAAGRAQQWNAGGTRGRQLTSSGCHPDKGVIAVLHSGREGELGSQPVIHTDHHCARQTFSLPSSSISLQCASSLTCSAVLTHAGRLAGKCVFAASTHKAARVVPEPAQQPAGSMRLT